MPGIAAPAAKLLLYDCGTMMTLWCWRCKREMPMLDEQEYAEIRSLHLTAIQRVKTYRKETGAALKDLPAGKHLAPMLARYKERTGYTETNPNAVLHHRISLYGPPCSSCGKPLRTPLARLCGSCMAPRK